MLFIVGTQVHKITQHVMKDEYGKNVFSCTVCDSDSNTVKKSHMNECLLIFQKVNQNSFSG